MAALGLLLLAAANGTAQDVDHEDTELPQGLQETLNWLPQETTVIIVARSFDLPRLDEQTPVEQLAPHEFVKLLLVVHAVGPVTPAWIRPLEHRRVAWGLHAAGEYETVSAFGAARYQGCHILRFDAPLGQAAGQVRELLRADARETRQIHGQEVSVIDWEFRVKERLPKKDWEGLFVVAPDPDSSEFIYATSERYLRDLLERRQAAAGLRAALPADLPQWSYIGASAPAWALKHHRQVDAKRAQLGLGFAMTAPSAGSAEQPPTRDAVRFVFCFQNKTDSPCADEPPPREFTAAFRAFELRTEVSRGKDGSVIVDVPLPTGRVDVDFDLPIVFAFQWLLLYSQGLPESFR